jgi:K(+)-stimulated pyrophosphate-energized sodium pump
MSLNDFLLAIVFLSSLLGIGLAFFLAAKVLKKDPGSKEMVKISTAINQGANAYLKRQFKTISLIIVFLAIFLFFTAQNAFFGWSRAIAFLVGALFSGLVGTVGMNLATRANSRVTAAARNTYKSALELAFQAGATTGMLMVGLGLLGATVIYALYREQATEVLIGFGFGGSLMALFMRVGGGIYTKAADVGADLVGKVEKNIPEDDPRNAAVIADLVGDNVGDCAGMAADLFESYEVTLVGAMILGGASFGVPGVLFPLLVRGLGVITSALGVFSVRTGEEGKGMLAIQRAFVISALASIIGFYFLARYYMNDLRLFLATTVGIILAVVISLLTQYFTSDQPPVREIAKSSQTGPATNILSGLTVGFESSVWAILVIGITILASFLIFQDPLQAAYGVALAGMGMLTTTGLIVSMDSYGPIADNAQGIAEMTKLKGKAEKILPQLDAIGNTTKATTKGFAIASAVVAAVSLFESFITETGLSGINVSHPTVFVGLLIGGAVPFLFSSLTIQAVSRAAFQVVNEVRRQFKEIKGLMEGKAEPDYERVVDICTRSSLKELMTPALVAILIPILVGLLLKEEALGAFLAGTILSGQLLAVLMANAGGAWDNAKKMIEAGLYGGKGSDPHKASVVGDTVGDPLKDTTGPSMNILIKVMNLVALLVVPLVIKYRNLTPQLWLLIIIAGSILFASIWLSKKRTVK